MDKKNTTIGILLLAAAFGLMVLNQRLNPPRPPPPPPATYPTGVETTDADPSSSSPDETAFSSAPTPVTTPGQPLSLPATTPSPNALFVPVTPQRSDERIVSLRNEFIEARFTNYGGAIADVALQKHRAVKEAADPLVLNAEHFAPAMAFTGFPGADFSTPYELVSQTADQVVWRTTVAGQLEITRTYRITLNPGEKDPSAYIVQHSTTLRNLGAGPVNLPGRLALNLGTAQPFNVSDVGQYLDVGTFDGEDADFIARDKLGDRFTWFGLVDGRPTPFIERLGPTVWATVENQFFATIVTPEKPGAGVIVRRVEMPFRPADPQARAGVTGDLLLVGESLSPGASETLNFDVYIGPKEYGRLVKLGQKQDKVMQWGNFIGFFSKLLLTLMTWLYGIVGNWGLAIISTTIVIRTMMWPLTAAGTKAAKRMQKIQVPLKEIQEKYKDNRAKQQEETLKLFKQHKVNPLGGCLPLIVQMPIFFGLFTMLRSASELRFAEFLWVLDLSAPDTIARIPGIGFPINIMVLLMGATQIVQMRLTPTPATDNASVKMMKFMPYFIVAICYNFSSGLAVYWTASNLFSIFQQWVTNRQKDPVEIAPAKPGAADRAKPVKDARVSTPGGRKKKR